MTTEIKEEIQDVSVTPVVVNTVDDPNNLSVTSLAPLPEKADEAALVAQKEASTPSKEEPVTEPENKEDEGKTKPTPEEEAAAKEEEKQTEKQKEEEVEAKPKDKDPVQARINEITKKYRTEERERVKREKELAIERARIKDLEAELKEAKRAIPAADKPKPEDFENEVEFTEALIDWKATERDREQEDTSKTADTKATEKKEVDDIYQEFDSKMESGREKYDDFDTLVLHEDLKISETMVQALSIMEPEKEDSAAPEDILYFLGKNQEISAQIAKMDPINTARALGKIEAKLNEPPAKPPEKKTTKAPDPITPVKTTGAVEKKPEDMTPAEYREFREGKQ